MTVTHASSPLLCSKRLNLALLCFAGCAIAYALRSNLSFAIVCMVKEDGNATMGERKSGCALEQQQKQQQQLQEISTTTNGPPLQNAAATIDPLEDILLEIPPAALGEFEWSKQIRGHVLGAFFFGYLTSQMLGGVLAAKFGPKSVILASILASSMLSLFSPGSARFHVIMFIMIRAFLGFTQGVLFPAMHALWSGWAPPMERGILTGISYAGAQIGNVMVMPLSGVLCRHGFDGGWPSIFYVLGAIGILWCLLWAFSAADSPQQHRTIKEEERKFIMDSLGQTKMDAAVEQKKRSIPVWAILTSRPVWAIFIGHFAGDWGAYTMALGLPSFLNDVLGMRLESMGFISALPYLFYFAVINIGGHLAYHIQKHKILSNLNTRRLAMLVALGGQALLLVAIGYCSCGQNTLVILLLTLSIGISGFQYAGFVVNYLDIGPQYAGFTLGIGNTLSCLAGLISPILMGWLTPTGSKEEWLLVFYVTGFILVAGAVIFSLMASAEVQQWAKDDLEQEKQQQHGGKEVESSGADLSIQLDDKGVSARRSLLEAEAAEHHGK